MACAGDLGWPVVHQPGQLRQLLAEAGPKGHFQVLYQPKGGDLVTHWETFAGLCIARKDLVIVADEVDGVCSAGSPSKASPYWKEHVGQNPALDTIVNYGRHSHVAMVAIARAPQDVWRRLTGQSREMLIFRMNERLEIEAVRNRLGSAADMLPNLGEFEYLRWTDDGQSNVEGGRE